MRDVKSLLLMCDAECAEAAERESPTAAEIVEVSDVGCFTWLWGKWCETTGDHKSDLLPEESDSGALTLLLPHPPACLYSAALSQTTMPAETTPVLMKIHNSEKEKNQKTVTRPFFLTNFSFVWIATDDSTQRSKLSASIISKTRRAGFRRHSYYSDEKEDISKSLWMTEFRVLHLTLWILFGTLVVYFIERQRAQSSRENKPFTQHDYFKNL